MKRRDFTKQSMLVSTLAAGRLTLAQNISANDTLGVAVIGCGSRGTGHLREVMECKDLNVEIRAVVDVWKPAREKAADLVEKTQGKKPDMLEDYREIFERKDIDAVTIATPDFSHARILKEMAQMKKDVYCEKPMAVDLEEANAAVDAVNDNDCIVQVGTQWRSDGGFIACAETLKSGVLGHITRVQISQNFNQPRWRKNYDDVDREDVNWKKFQLHAPPRAFDPKRFKRWYLYHDYTNGLPGLWMSHYLNLVAWYMDDPYPGSVCASGNVYHWGEDGRQTFDTLGAIMNYPKGWQLNFSMSLCNSADTHCIFYGTHGKLDVWNRVLSGDGGEGEQKIEEETVINPVPSTTHMHDFLNCVRTRQEPRSPIRMGYAHSVAGIMVAESIRLGQRLGYDPTYRKLYSI